MSLATRHRYSRCLIRNQRSSWSCIGKYDSLFGKVLFVNPIWCFILHWNPREDADPVSTLKVINSFVINILISNWIGNTLFIPRIHWRTRLIIIVNYIKPVNLSIFHVYNDIYIYICCSSLSSLLNTQVLHYILSSLIIFFINFQYIVVYIFLLLLSDILCICRGLKI